MALNPITFTFPTQVEPDGSLVSFIDSTSVDGIEAQVHRWVEGNEEPRIVMTLETPGNIAEFDLSQVEGLRDLGIFPKPQLLDDAIVAMGEFSRLRPLVFA